MREGSAAGTVWSLPVAGTMTGILSAGVAELASAYPVSGAEYYWSFCLASEDWQAFASYMFVPFPQYLPLVNAYHCLGTAG